MSPCYVIESGLVMLVIGYIESSSGVRLQQNNNAHAFIWILVVARSARCCRPAEEEAFAAPDSCSHYYTFIIALRLV